MSVEVTETGKAPGRRDTSHRSGELTTYRALGITIKLVDKFAGLVNSAASNSIACALSRMSELQYSNVFLYFDTENVIEERPVVYQSQHALSSDGMALKVPR